MGVTKHTSKTTRRVMRIAARSLTPQTPEACRTWFHEKRDECCAARDCACHQRPGFRQRDWASRPRRVVEAWADVNQVADAFDGEESEAQASVRMLSEIRHP